MKAPASLVHCVQLSAITIMTAGCSFLSPTEIDLIGTFESSLPENGTEVIEIKSGGICHQVISFKNGKKISTDGTWKYEVQHKNINLKGLYITLDFMGNIVPDMPPTTDTLRILAVKYDVFGNVLIGYDEGEQFQKRR
jgi:hypothetical protein